MRVRALGELIDGEVPTLPLYSPTGTPVDPEIVIRR
jgi:hypothetical protein